MKKRIRRDKEIKISLTQEEMEHIEKIAKKIGKTKSHLARNLVMVVLEDIELFNKLGFFEAVKLIEKIRIRALGINKMEIINNKYFEIKIYDKKRDLFIPNNYEYIKSVHFNTAGQIDFIITEFVNVTPGGEPYLEETKYFINEIDLYINFEKMQNPPAHEERP